MSEKFFIPIKCLFLCIVCCCLFSSCAKQRKVEAEPFYQADQAQIRRYRENISVKKQNEDFITYEYKDIRIDEIAVLAADYCQRYGKEAYLREILLYRNHLRRATFDCTALANNK